MTSLRVLAVASEIYPIVKTGGLADVAGALPAALRAYDIETRTLVPGYPDVIKALPAAAELLHLPNFFGGPARLLGGSHGDLDLPPCHGWRPRSVGVLRHHSYLMSCTPTIGRRDWRRPICTMPIVLGRPP
jgi:hypothetical protein